MHKTWRVDGRPEADSKEKVIKTRSEEKICNEQKKEKVAITTPVKSGAVRTE